MQSAPHPEPSTSTATPAAGIRLEHAVNRPIVVLAVPGVDLSPVVQSLLASPGTWSAVGLVEQAVDSAADGEWTAGHGDRRTSVHATTAGDRVRDLLTEGWRQVAEVRRRGGLVAEPRPVVAGPADALRVPFWADLFPEARFVLVHEDPRISLLHATAACLDAEAVPRVADWETLRATGVGEAASAHWETVVSTLLDDLEALPAERWTVTTPARLRSEPVAEGRQLFEALGLGWHGRATRPWAGEAPGLPVVLREVFPTEQDFAPHAARLAPTADRVVARLPAEAHSLLDSTPAGSLSATDDGFAAVLRRLGCSVLVSTYQSHRLVALRADGDALGVHLRAFDRPMGIAPTPDGFALGTRSEIWDFRDAPQVARKLSPQGRHDACFLPRNSHVTGDVAVHDMARGADGMWIVATGFNCLATLDTAHSFVPRWSPPFISALVPEDRCHLNGLAMVDGEPRFVTALGTSDELGGWRATKEKGGVVMDVRSGEILVSGLSMPHSPRWHEGRLYVLESGHGRLSVCDLETGATEVVAELPGFTRGLSFHGGLAFVATSQIRETATFGGLPIQALERRECGVWAVDLATGKVVGSVRFDDRIEEVFDVCVLPGVTYPEVAEPDSDLVRRSWLLPSQG